MTTEDKNSSLTASSSSLVVGRTIESILGSEIHGEFPNTDYQGVTGTLYAGNNAVYFVGATYMFFATTELLFWKDIKQVQKMNDDAIEIVTIDETTLQDVRYQFRIMDHASDRDKLWLLLMSLHNDALIDHDPSFLLETTPTSNNVVRKATPRGSMIKRTNSDPMMASSGSPSPLSIVSARAGTTGSITISQAGDEHSSSMKTPQNQMMRQRSMTPFHETQPQQQPQQLSDIQLVESLAGKLWLQPIQCRFNAIEGKFYAGRVAVYFVGRKSFFFWDKQEVLILWDTIQKVQLLEISNGFNQHMEVGIQIVAQDKEDAATSTVYSFDNMDNPSQVLASLLSLHNDNLLTSGRRRSRTVRRMNSDPLMALHADLGEETRQVDDKVLAVVDAVQPKSSIISPAKPNDTDDWTELQADQLYATKVVTDHVLKCSLDRFHELFLSDVAVHSMAKFLESRGDSNLQSTPWIADGVYASRTITYTHPVNAPMAPPQAVARREQVLRRYGNHGLALVTKTFVQDVPMTDCFYISDRIRVEARDDAVVVFIEFEVVFVKSTMFKGIINRTATSECNALLQALAEYMSQAFGDDKQVTEEVRVVHVKPDRATSALVEMLQHPLLPLILFIIFLQLCILWSVRKTNVTMQYLQVTVDEMQQMQQDAAMTCMASNGTLNG